MKLKIAKHYEETWAEKESEYKEKIEKQEVRSRATASGAASLLIRSRALAGADQAIASKGPGGGLAHGGVGEQEPGNHVGRGHETYVPQANVEREHFRAQDLHGLVQVLHDDEE